jgi:hypothetical protein
MYDIMYNITSLLASHWLDGDAMLDVRGIDVQNDGYWNCSGSNTELGQFKSQ